MKKIGMCLVLCYGGLFLAVSVAFWLFLHLWFPNLISGPEVLWLAPLYVLATLIAFTLAGFKFAQLIIEPVVSLSKRLDLLDINTIKHKLSLPEQGPELQRLVDQINDLLTRIHDGLANLNKYSAQVAHELRTPLTVIRLKIEQAANKIDPRLAEEVQKELLRLTLHLERTLLIARAEQGHLPLHRTDFDLKEVLTQVAEGFRLLAAEEKRALDLKSSSTVIHADLAYSKQILYNLLSNALHHGQGTIHVRLRFTRQSVYLLVVNKLKRVRVETYSLGLGNRIVKALASVHGNMHVRHKKWRNHYSVQLIIGPLSYFSP